MSVRKRLKTAVDHPEFRLQRCGSGQNADAPAGYDVADPPERQLVPREPDLPFARSIDRDGEQKPSGGLWIVENMREVLGYFRVQHYLLFEVFAVSRAATGRYSPIGIFERARQHRYSGGGKAQADAAGRSHLEAVAENTVTGDIRQGV